MMEDTTVTVFNDNSSFINTTAITTTNIPSDEYKEELWLTVFQQSQLAMTFVGLFANIGTSITLIKNGQASLTIILFRYSVSPYYLTSILLHIVFIFIQL